MVSTAWLPSRSTMRRIWPRLISFIQGSPAGRMSSSTARAGSRVLSRIWVFMVSLLDRVSEEVAFGVAQAAGVLGPRQAADVISTGGAGTPGGELDGLRVVGGRRVQRV